MNAFTKSAAGLAMLSLFAVAQASPPTVNPEQMDLDTDMMAKILKEKSKQNTGGNAAAGEAGTPASKDCGSVNIGNSAPKIGAPPSSKTVIITGPVLNMANCK